MTKRECGSCTACCEGWLSADALDMRPGRACRHCTEQGCAIYENRPEDPCVRFKCAWLEDQGQYPDEMRPDRSGVIAIRGRKWRNWKVLLAIPAGQSVPQESLEWLRKHAQKSGLPLVFHERLVTDGEFAGAKARAYGSPVFADAVKYSLGPDDVIKM
jgi:hypothetical protein